MCGIVGYTGNKPAEKVLLDGLKRLEYRGYDSAGFSLSGDHKLLTVKAVGKVKNLEIEAQKYGEMKQTCGISRRTLRPECASAPGQLRQVRADSQRNHRKLRGTEG